MLKTDKKTLFLLVSLILGGVLMFLAFRQVNPDEIMTVIFLFPKEGLLAIFLVNFLAVFLVSAKRWQVILEGQGCKIGFLKVLRAKMAGFALSYITPSAMIGGEPIRAYMIKEESGCGWERSFAAVIIDQIIFFFCLFVAMIAGFVLLAEHFSLPMEVFYLFLSVFFLAVFVFYVLYNRILNRGAEDPAFLTYLLHKTGLDRLNFVRCRLKSVDITEKSIERFFHKEKICFFQALFWGGLETLLDVASVALTCFCLGQPFGVMESFGIFFFLTLANFFPIPGALGSLEFALNFVFNILGMGGGLGLVFSLVYRLINIVLCILGFAAIAYFSLKTLSHHFSLETPPALLSIHRFFVRFFGHK